MVGIPPVLPDDPEDVVWALQTAEALFRRDERADALVWLRRAAQAAGEAELDERALTLSRAAADIAEALDAAKAGGELMPESEDIEVSSIDLREFDDDATQKSALDGHEEELRRERALRAEANKPTSTPMQAALPSFLQDELDAAPLPPPLTMGDPFKNDAAAFPAPAAKPAAASAPAQKAAPRADAPKRPPAPPPLPPRAKPPTAPMSPSRAFTPAASPPPRRRENSAPLITEASRGSSPGVDANGNDVAPAQSPESGRWMRPPLASKPETIEVPEVEPLVPERQSLAPARSPAGSQTQGAHEEETTQQTRMEDLPQERAAEPAHEYAAPPDSERTPFGGAREEHLRASMDDAQEPVPDALPTQPETVEEEASPPPLSPDEPAFGKEEGEEEEVERQHESEKRTPLVPTALLDIDALEAFADLPDDVREQFAKEARIVALAEGEAASSFALAAVLKGEIDVAARDAGVAAVRLVTQQVLYARSSIEAELPMQLIGASEVAEIAIWDRDDVERVMRACPWVEDDLRASSDPIQAVVGMTLGPFGDRLDGQLRALVTSRLSVQSLAEGDVIVSEGTPVSGLFVIGAGLVEIVSGSDIKGALGPGDFLFPAEVIAGGRAHADARAGRGGVLLLSCDRSATQELFMVCPPLLDILSSST